MALASYCTINSKKYRVVAQDYSREVVPLKTVRTGVLGNTIVSMGPGSSEQFTRTILYVPYTPPDSTWGTVSDFKTAAESASVSYTDHITSESGVFGQGTFNITILNFTVEQLPGATRPTSGYHVAAEWQVVNA